MGTHIYVFLKMSVKNRLLLLKNLLYSMAVAKTGSITQAAAQNGIKAANLSRLMKEFEEALGCPLFHRKSTGVELTREGYLVMEEAKRLEDELEELEYYAISRASTANHVDLYLPSNLRLMDLEKFYKAYPGIQIDILTDVGSFDVGVFYEEPFLPKDFIVTQHQINQNSVGQMIWVAYRDKHVSAIAVYDFIVSRLV